MMKGGAGAIELVLTIFWRWGAWGRVGSCVGRGSVGFLCGMCDRRVGE